MWSMPQNRRINLAVNTAQTAQIRISPTSAREDRPAVLAVQHSRTPFDPG